MSMRSYNGLFVFTFVLALAAGVTAGMLVMRLSGSRQSVPPAAQGLVEELNLSPGQRDQIKAIWEAVQQTSGSDYAEARKLEQRRDDQIQALMTSPEQKEQYRKIMQAYADAYATLKASQDKTMNDAIARTRALLNDAQRARYDAIIADRVGRGRHDGAVMSRG